MNVTIQKNILDLEYQKNLMIISTSVVIAFTYFIGLAIGFLSHQFSFYFIDVTILISLTAGVIGICLFIFLRATSKLEVIKECIRKLSY